MLSKMLFGKNGSELEHVPLISLKAGEDTARWNFNNLYFCLYYDFSKIFLYQDFFSKYNFNQSPYSWTLFKYMFTSILAISEPLPSYICLTPPLPPPLCTIMLQYFFVASIISSFFLWYYVCVITFFARFLSLLASVFSSLFLSNCFFVLNCFVAILVIAFFLFFFL